MDKKQSLIQFYKNCVKHGYIDMRNEEQRLDAKVVASDLELKYKDIAALFEEAKCAAEQAEEDAKRRSVAGEELVAIRGYKETLKVYLRPDGSVYSVFNNDKKIEDRPKINVKKGGTLSYTYNPAKAVYTGATVGGITTGGIHYTEASYSEKVVGSGKGYIDVTVGGQTFTVSSFVCAPNIKERFNRDGTFKQFADTAGVVSCQQYSYSARQYATDAMRTGNTQLAMSALSRAADKERLPYAHCVAIADLLGQIIYQNFPPTDEELYNNAVSLLKSDDAGKQKQAEAILIQLLDYRDSKDIVYKRASALSGAGTSSELTRSIELFKSIPDYKDSEEQFRAVEAKINSVLHEEKKKAIIEKEAQKKRNKTVALIAGIVAVLSIIVSVVITQIVIPSSRYKEAERMVSSGDYAKAAVIFGSLGSYSDSRERSLSLWSSVAASNVFDFGANHTVGLKADGTVVAVGESLFWACDVSDWTDIVAVDASWRYTVGLKLDGTVVAVGYNDDGQCNVSGWRDIVAVETGVSYTVGLKADGTVVAVGNNKDGRCDVSDWTDIVAVAVTSDETIGLKSDGTVVATGSRGYDVSVSDWDNIVAVSANSFRVVGLKADGTVVAFGNNKNNQCDVSCWTDIVAVEVGSNHIVGLKADGTVVAVGENKFGECDVSGWTDIVGIYAGGNCTVGLRSDGTVVAVGYNSHGQCDVSDWSNIVEIFASGEKTAGLRADGTVIAVGENIYGECDVSDWTGIKVPN